MLFKMDHSGLMRLVSTILMFTVWDLLLARDRNPNNQRVEALGSGEELKKNAA